MASQKPVALRTAAGSSLVELQPLVEAIFPAPDRPAGWFRRKLAREAVDPAWSTLAFGTGGEIVGYFLVGDDVGEARSAGLGVSPAHRGHGTAAGLIELAIAALRRAGVGLLGTSAEPPVRGFYERVGFREVGVRHTLLAPACGRVDLELAGHPPTAWSLPGREVAGWRPGAWSRTPSASAATVTLVGGAATVHLSREGRAILVQRMCVDEASPNGLVATTHAALDELRRHFSEGTPLLLHGCEAVSCVTAALLRGGPWHVVQTACEMQRPL